MTLLTRRGLLKIAAPALIGLAAPSLILPKPAPAFWQSRDSGYNKSTGGGFSLCAGTPIHIEAGAPNNPTFWDPPVNSSTSTGVSDPLSGTAAWALLASPTNFCFIEYRLTGVGGGTVPASSTVYSVEGYAKPLAFSAGAFLQVHSNGADAFGATMDLVAGTVSGTASGTGSFTCGQIEPSTNGYFHFSVAGIVTTTAVVDPRLRLWTIDSDGNAQSHVANQTAYYNVTV